jgi:hypothetical protein
MEVTEALRTSILELHDHLHINHVRAFGRSVLATQITGSGAMHAVRSAAGGRPYRLRAFSPTSFITQRDASCDCNPLTVG